jgi:hypothetical protein
MAPLAQLVRPDLMQKQETTPGPASAAPGPASAAPEPTALPYNSGPYGPRITVTTTPASTEMPNAGGQATVNAAETLQVPVAAPRRSRGSYRTAGLRGLSIPGAI